MRFGKKNIVGTKVKKGKENSLEVKQLLITNKIYLTRNTFFSPVVGCVTTSIPQPVKKKLLQNKGLLKQFCHFTIGLTSQQTFEKS